MRESATAYGPLRSGWLKPLLLCVFSLLLITAGIPLPWVGLQPAAAQPSTPQASCYITNGTVNAIVTTGSTTYVA